MTLQSKRWLVASPAPAAQLERFPDLPPLITQLLYNREITEPSAVKAFLDAEFEGGNPFLLKGVNEAVARLRQAIRQGEPIAIYGDFDVDGVAGTVLLMDTLTALGARAEPYIPHRAEEGYGLHNSSLRHLAEKGVKVVVTVDCGTRAVTEVAYGKRLGLDIIVTDHHSVPKELPPAVAVINPHQEDCRYPFKQLSGVGTAFKLAQALLLVERKVPVGSGDLSLSEEDLLDLVALGTVTDVVPLVSENRTLVKWGLERLNRPQRQGLERLIAKARLKPGEIDSTAISFIIGPRLNAAGRLDHAMVSYRLLASRSLEEAESLAKELEQKNRARQELTVKTLDKAREEVLAVGVDQPVLFAAGKDYLAGVVGLVASRLVEEFYRPAVVIELGEEESRGSCRSIPEFNIVAALDQCQDLLLRHGGHAMAAGFTVANRNLPALQERMLELAEGQLAGCDLRPVLAIDAEVSLAEMGWETQALLSQMEPFGQSNPEPIFLTRGVTVRRCRLVGEDHLKLTLTEGDLAWDAIAFHQAHWADKLPTHIDVAYTLEVNEWQDERRLQLNVK
ncbi:MAG: single-stranded-DNA-specific exonuclease RecJ, partial [Anaerolineae bacterium]